MMDSNQFVPVARRKHSCLLAATGRRLDWGRGSATPKVWDDERIPAHLAYVFRNIALVDGTLKVILIT
jgi:hypothetical protein